jgi:hypothetical protein
MKINLIGLLAFLLVVPGLTKCGEDGSYDGENIFTFEPLTITSYLI